MSGLPRVEIIEEGMREGMQIESADIPVEAKIRLLDALSRTGLRTIQVGSFVSPRWVPQMEHIEQVIQGFTPVPGVRYTALALNQKGAERRAQHVPPLAPQEPAARTTVHLCDVFVQRNTARTQAAGDRGRARHRRGRGRPGGHRGRRGDQRRLGLELARGVLAGAAHGV